MVVLTLVLVGCGILGGNTNPAVNNPYAKYYVGTRGVQATFVNMPTRLYYNGADDSTGNAFVIGVDAHNRGASFSRGGVYVSGFDPALLVFNEIPILRGGADACGISIGTIGFGEFGGIFSCPGFGISGGSGIFNFHLDTSKVSWWDPSQFNFKMDCSSNPSGNACTAGWPAGQIDYYQHGRLFIALLAGLDFSKNGGREFMLAGNTYDFPGGEDAYFEYNGRIVDWPPGLDQTTQNLLLTSCYQYTTFADPIVCIDPAPESDNRKVCIPQSRTWSGGNGGPVSITSIEQENTPRKIIFHINVKNVGIGTVYDPGKLEKCSPYSPERANQADLNVVYLGDVRVGQTGLRGVTADTGAIICYPEVIRLDPTTKTGSTTCNYPIQYVNLKSAYQTPLVVELWYGYSETQTWPLTLKRMT